MAVDDRPDPISEMAPNEAINEAHSAAATHKRVNAWQQPGPACLDFRSDTMTTPTASMLEAIMYTTLQDDVMVEDPTTNNLESYIAELAGHEAALLVMSGTMGNQVALRTHLTAPPHSVLCDIRSHIYNYEAGGVSSLSSAMILPIRPRNGHHLTLEDVKEHAIVSSDVHACPTRVISLENTLDGMIMPLAEVRRIAEFARAHDIKLHLDGARIWEAVAANAASLPDYCTLFDSVSMCFSKGLGAPIGSIIVGSKPYIAHARRIRKMIGGGTRQAGVISAAARVAVDEGFGHGPNGEGGNLRASHARARNVAEMWTSRGGKLANPTETNMVWLDLAREGISATEFARLAAEEGLKAFSGRLVVHYQITDEAVERLGRVMDAVLRRGRERETGVADGETTDGVNNSNGNGERYGSKESK
ncbi:threonine aldolase [Cladophialophora yegresii CBS 114405]|uniref:Threonine aldolase n=1 Tax=Cladophialophora yegresii CBS 114405 TaxID=1182544 RepID=W9WEQ9_9EURO|nr:threonine aldolase [Cladophialophora yegresii CBS 114405]EXJ57014.1 threonine aldolase [Cladophialophora yegresii CBS 114405]